MIILYHGLPALTSNLLLLSSRQILGYRWVYYIALSETNQGVSLVWNPQLVAVWNQPKGWMESRQRRVWHQAAGTLFYTRFAQCHARLRRGSIQRVGHVDSIPSLREPPQLAHSLRGTPTAAWINKKGTFGSQKFLFCCERTTKRCVKWGNNSKKECKSVR